jgi:hypothetical protein
MKDFYIYFLASTALVLFCLLIYLLAGLLFPTPEPFRQTDIFSRHFDIYVSDNNTAPIFTIDGISTRDYGKGVFWRAPAIPADADARLTTADGRHWVAEWREIKP